MAGGIEVLTSAGLLDLPTSSEDFLIPSLMSFPDFEGPQLWPLGDSIEKDTLLASTVGPDVVSRAPGTSTRVSALAAPDVDRSEVYPISEWRLRFADV